MKTKTFLCLCVFMGLATLNNCSKDKVPYEGKTYEIDLTDVKYAALLNPGGSYVIDSEATIVANTNQIQDIGYQAARSICPHCNNAIQYPKKYAETWKCSGCNSIWHYDGRVDEGPSTATLRIYSVTKSGNILTIGY
jgi:ribosomal protein L37AE/L43A